MRSEADVRPHNMRIRVLGDNLARHPRVLRARAARRARLALLLGRVHRVEPQHIGGVLEPSVSLHDSSGVGTYISPDGHDEHHRQADGLVQGAEAANLRLPVALVPGNVVRLAVLRVDGVGVARDALGVGRGDLDDGAVLDEDVVDLVVTEAGDDAGVVSIRLPATPRGFGTHVKGSFVLTVLSCP